MIVIGITGTLGAGKGTIVDFLLRSEGFAHYSVRGYLVEEIIRRGMEPDRDKMVMVANELRAAHGSGYIIEQLYEQAKKTGTDCIIESIRAVGEIVSLQNRGDFFLLAVDADQRIRYDRIFARGSETDHIDFQTFVANEQREMTSTDPNKQNLSACMKLANFTLQNNGSVEELEQNVKNIIDGIRRKQH
ncbi:MAG: AAA family ATPase [Bacteroidetes bacterium]|nr:AAA family ATPase [Bacteroidota bacterium]MBU1719284.1 AAA family ATPase [Bacteroidota bacterium]